MSQSTISIGPSPSSSEEPWQKLADSLPATTETIERLKRLRTLRAQQQDTERARAAATLAQYAESTPSFELTGDQAAADQILVGGQRHTLLVGGSRSGKTSLLVRGIGIRALTAPGSRHAILRFRQNAARQSISLDTLPKIFRLCWPKVEIAEHRQDGFFSLPNDSEIWVAGLDDKERIEKILGKEFATIFFNECSQIPYSSIVIALTRLAQVVGDLVQRAYYDLNPVGKKHWTNVLFGEKRDPVSRQPLANPADYARMFLNPAGNVHNLSPEYLLSLQQLPERQRKRFFDGVYVDEVEGALWSYERIEQLRVIEFPIERCRRVVVAVDPSGAGSPDEETKDEIGIVVVGLGDDGHAYVLADRSVRDSPAVWGRVVATAYHEFRADQTIAEVNFGGEMVRFVIRVADPQVPVKVITASRAKAVRADPVSALYEQGLVHHVGRFGILEDQLCAFTTYGYRGLDSPDRADALVWALTDLMVDAAAQGWIEFYRQKASEANSRPEPGAAPAKPAVPELAGDLMAIYRAAAAESGPKPPTCKNCGKPVGASRISDGVDVWHPPGDLECRR